MSICHYIDMEMVGPERRKFLKLMKQLKQENELRKKQKAVKKKKPNSDRTPEYGSPEWWDDWTL